MSQERLDLHGLRSWRGDSLGRMLATESDPGIWAGEGGGTGKTMRLRWVCALIGNGEETYMCLLATVIPQKSLVAIPVCDPASLTRGKE